MGVPKFFRWLSERYPKINQRAGFLPEEDTCKEHFGQGPPPPCLPPDPLSTCGLPPPVDRLYVDMNGVIHGCSHNNNATSENLSNEEIFANIAYYLDRIIGDIAKPTELVYLSVDGVAPRAKLNQQRSRRYRSGNEGEIEETIYEAHLHKDEPTVHTDVLMQDFGAADLKEVEPGRFTGKFESHAEQARDANDFHHNSITPGTPFFQECTEFIQNFIEKKLATDPKWQHLTIIFSGPNVPGEGEHKIMDFIRREKKRPDYNPNLRHCIMGQDGDWIMLGLASHEPNLVLLREQVIFDASRRNLVDRGGIDAYIHNPNFEWLHMGILRDYLSFEFETRNVVATSSFDLEATLDDFVFLTFFVGNDFLPHMPALDIADEAFDLLFYTYRSLRQSWQEDDGEEWPYLTRAGNIVSGKRLEEFLAHLGQHELPYYDNKKGSLAQMRASDKKAGFDTTIPTDDVIESKEESDRARYREMLQSYNQAKETMSPEFTPVLSKAGTFRPSQPEEAVEEGLFSRMSSVLRLSIDKGGDSSSSSATMAGLDDQDLKGRYYYDKFGFTPFDAEKHIALRKAYIEGLVWNLKYYYEGCASWEWYYPYHYGPMLSDLVNIDEMLDNTSFEEKGEPLKPFEQLMGCMPPSSAYLLPKPYQWLLQDESSPISDFYPRVFTVDMNGKRWPWEAVVLLPFIDSKRLISAARSLVTDDMLSEEERERNMPGHALVLTHGRDSEASVRRERLDSTQWDYQPTESCALRPELTPGVQHPQAGFPSLKEAPIQSLWRRNVGINVFGMRSRYRTALLVLDEAIPTFPPIEIMGKKLIGTTIFFNFPFLTEGFVTALSNSELCYRGTSEDGMRRWDANEATFFRQKSSIVKKEQAFGEKLTGTGGWMMPDSDIMVSVRPLQGLKTLADGSKAKVFAKFEVEVPLTAAIWAPSYEDPRISNVPALLEKDPYLVAPETTKDASSPSLLPDYHDKVKEEMNQSVGPMLSTYEADADPFAPTVILPGFEDQDPPVMLPPLEDPEHPGHLITPEAQAAPVALLPPDVEKPKKKSHTARRRGQGRRSKSKSRKFRKPPASLLPGGDLGIGVQSSAQVVSGGLPRLSESNIPRRSYSTARRTPQAYAAVKGNTRVRFLAFGVAAAASVFMNGGGAHALDRPDCHRNLGMLPPESSAIFAIRGGYQASGENSDTVSSVDDVKPPPLEFEHGTTTLSFTFQGGIVAAVDSRASLGNFVGSKTTQKVLPVNTHILGTMAGGAADCSHLIRKLKGEAQLHELTEGRRMSVARASRILSNWLYNTRAHGLSVGTMIMGFDQDDGVPRIFYVDNTGVRTKGDLFAVGSGGTFALGILDTERRFDMTEDEAIALGIKAIRHATFRDAYSGGFIGVYVINKDGCRKVFSEDLARAIQEGVVERNEHDG